MALSHCVFMLMASLRVTASVKVTKFVAKSVIFRVTLDIYSRFCCSGVWLLLLKFALLEVVEQPDSAHIARAAVSIAVIIAANFFAVEFEVVWFFIVLLSICCFI